MALLGRANFAWQSDYGQFYVIDTEDAGFRAPETITPEMEGRGLHVPQSGLVIYTQDCLQQHIRIAIHASQPVPSDKEPMSGRAWTRVETVRARFPYRTFTLTSPSAPDVLPCGPFFALPASEVMVRISWMEFEGSRDDSLPVEPDVIQLEFWPA